MRRFLEQAVANREIEGGAAKDTQQREYLGDECRVSGGLGESHSEDSGRYADPRLFLYFSQR